jgi:hypothetical protein
MPIIEVQNLRREPEAPAAQERRVCQQQKAPVLIGIGGIERRTIVAGRTVDQEQAAVHRGRARTQYREFVAMGAELQ